MQLHDLHPADNSRKVRKRVGRGIAAGQGKTSGRGQKGQGARSGAAIRRGFEGGQMPLAQRLPKLRGFHNRWKTEYAIVNVGKLNRFAASTIIDAALLKSERLIDDAKLPVKVLGAGTISVAVTVRVTKISKAAKVAIEAAGGTVEILGGSTEAAEQA